MITLARIAAAAARISLVAALLLGASAPVAADETVAYTYDGLGRLVKVARSGTVNSGTSECYAYDPAANRTNVTVATSADCSSSGGPVSFSIASNGPVTEGTNSVFTITKSGTASTSLTVSYATANGTAVAPGDYTAKALTVLTFTSAQTSKTVSVTTIDDATIESAETFTMALSAPSGGSTIGTGTATATINDNDSTPTCSGVTFTVASNAAITEGANSVFTITKSGTASGSCNVSYATANGTATAGSDYTTKSGTLTFTSTQTSQTVSVATIDDTTVESAETFTMSLSAPTGGATLGSPSSATATINDNDSSTNQPPVANPDSAATTACGTVSVNVVANDTDPEGNYPLALTAIVSSTRGTAQIIGTTTIEYTAITSSGTGLVTYTVADSLGATANGTLSVTISGGVCP